MSDDPYDHKQAVRQTDAMNNWFRESFANQMKQYYEGRNVWFQESFDNCARPHIAAINRQFGNVHDGMDGLAEETGVVIGQTDNVVRALIDIVKELTADNTHVRGRVDRVEKYWIKHKEKTFKTDEHEEHPSPVTRTVALIDEILAA